MAVVVVATVADEAVKVGMAAAAVAVAAAAVPSLYVAPIQSTLMASSR